jgi:hypothetical protein
MEAKWSSFEQLEIILKRYWKFEKMCKVQEQWRREFAMEPPTRLTTASICDKY